MWTPKTEEELIHAVQGGVLSETSTFDGKKEVPSKSKETAKDVAAMATDGGVIIYGLDEDEHKRLTILHPIPLAGTPERIDAIVRSGIAEAPQIRIHTIPTNDDPSVGYIVVTIPPSPRAPHMVTIDKDHRYYGRSATGNAPLTEAEVARLYARRQQWEVDRDQLLDGFIQQFAVQPDAKFGYLYLIARAVSTDGNMLASAVKGLQPQEYLQKLVREAGDPSIFPRRYYPDIGEARGWEQTPEGWLGYLDYSARYSPNRTPNNVLDIQINFDGSATLFSGRAADILQDQLFIFEETIAGLTVRFLWILGQIYNAVPYMGMVDIGCAITNIQGAMSSGAIRDFGHTYLPFTRPTYQQTMRASAMTLATEPITVARSLIEPLVRTTTQGWFKVFPNA